MLQTFIQALISILACAVALLALIKCSSLKFLGTIVSWDLCLAAERTPALNAFLMFVLQAAVITLTVVSFLMHISNSAIISLDIIYLLSILMLVLFHTIKESHSLLVKSV